jgi:hypothetical protein
MYAKSFAAEFWIKYISVLLCKFNIKTYDQKCKKLKNKIFVSKILNNEADKYVYVHCKHIQNVSIQNPTDNI